MPRRTRVTEQITLKLNAVQLRMWRKAAGDVPLATWVKQVVDARTILKVSSDETPIRDGDE